MATHAAYMEGFHAATLRHSREKCPYPPETAEQAEWVAGWEAGDDHEEVGECSSD